MEKFSALLALGEGNPSVTGEFPAKGTVTRSFDVLFDLLLNKRKCKQSWFETPSTSLSRHCNAEMKIGWLVDPHLLVRFNVTNLVRLITINHCSARHYRLAIVTSRLTKFESEDLNMHDRLVYATHKYVHLESYILNVAWVTHSPIKT